MFKLLLSIAILVACACCSTKAVIQEEDALNDANEVVFQVLKGNLIKVANRQRVGQPWLKLELNTKVDSIVKVNSTAWTLTLSDKSSLDFVLEDKDGGNVTESYLVWHKTDPWRDLCFHNTYNNASWYNGYQRQQPSWPMDSSRGFGMQQFNYLFDVTNTDNAVRNHLFILEHLFVNSDGFAILLDQYAPWLAGNGATGLETMVCFRASDRVMPYPTVTDPTYLDIKIRLFSSSNIRAVTDYVIHQSGHIPVPTSVPSEAVFRHASWMLHELNIAGSANILTFASELANNGFYSWHTNGHRFIFPAQGGSYLIDMLAKTAVPQEDLLIELTEKRAFQVVVGFSSPTLTFNVLDRKLYAAVKLSGSNRDTSFVDLSLPEACTYFTTHLSLLRFKKQLDYYMLTASVNIDYGFNSTHFQKYPSLLTTSYVEAVNRVDNITVISEYAFKTQHLPVWLRLTHNYRVTYEQQLLDLIPNVLSVSLAGYSFIMPYTVGGQSTSSKPSEELFIRMIQAVAFMPSISISKKPWEYGFKANELTKTFLELHEDHVPVMLKLANKRITEGSPIIRPMWYVAPDDARTYSIGDQYMLGDDIVVAPVLRVGQTQRSVYLPAGVWFDQHGKKYDGPGEFTVDAPLEELPYFKRNAPDDDCPDCCTKKRTCNYQRCML